MLNLHPRSHARLLLSAAACAALVAAACGGGGEDEPAASAADAAAAAQEQAQQAQQQQAAEEQAEEPQAQAQEQETEADQAEAEPARSEPSAAAEIVSDDGSAVLALPEGALPADVSAEDVQVVALDPAAIADDPTTVAAIYRLAPDGLVLEQPATLTFEVELPESGGVFAILISNEQSELLTEISVEGEGGGPGVVSVAVPHFSEVGIFTWAPPRGTLTVTPDPVGTHKVGETFEATDTVGLGTPVDETDDLTMTHNGRRYRQVIEVSVGIGSDWSHNFGSVRPSGPVARSEFFSRRSVSGTATFSANLTCTDEGDFALGWEHDADVRAEVEITQTWVDSGEEFFRQVLRSQAGQRLPGQAGVSPKARGDGAVTGECTAPDDPPRVSPILAEANPPFTTYSVEIAPRTGITVSYTWSGANCGSAQSAAGTPHVYVWRHDGDDCPHDTLEHRDATIMVLVDFSDRWRGTCSYIGAADGVGPPCKITFRP